MPQLFADAARGELLSDITATDTALNLSFGGALFPVADAGASAGEGSAQDWFKAVLQDRDGFEIVYVGSHTAGSDQFTNVKRGQEGTTAKAFTAGSVFGLRMTAADVTGLAPKAQPTLTGVREVRVAMPANAIDLDAGNLFTKTVAGATTFTVSNVPPAGTLTTFVLELTNAGAHTITWWDGITGPNIKLSSTGRDVLVFYTHDGGTTWTRVQVAEGL